MEYNLADLYEAIADAVPDNIALASGDVHHTYSDLDKRANQLAHYLQSRGIGAGDHVGLHLFNGHEFVEAILALFKLRAVGINVNYRFVGPEVRYMVDNADLKGIITQRRFLPVINEAMQGLEPLQALIVIEDGADAVSDQESVEYENAMSQGSEERDFGSRSGNDLYIVYTGGTTGMPKGVMWRHEDLFFTGLQGGSPGGDPVESPEQLIEQVKEGWYTVSMLPCAPFIHGSAQWTQWICHLTGGKLVLQHGPSFDAKRILALVGEEELSTLSLVGDAMAIPLVEELRAGDYDMSNLAVIASAGAILSASIQAEIEELLPDVMIINSFGTSEAGDLGRAAADEDSHEGRPSFYMGDDVTVLDEEGKQIEPGSGNIGLVARSGRLPLGYYKDPEKTAERFKEFNGKRWVVPGDFATIEEDGRITFLGRGSKCINTGGEKVFPEEVEEALKAHPEIIDALVVAVPDPRFGSKVAAVFNTRDNKQLTLEEVKQHCRNHIAGYKIPRQITITETVSRMPSGKPDYPWAEEIAREQASAQTASP
ncbi:MAG: acyl-CoA synthetase [Deltaproteobacteria bacterium]|nr:acyl-CoA synthetase [Deltaproteobacteria bacterium]MBW2378729.1 acyl-CoA synthetase [Deltaproteobacteria bacterium]MBW2628457.1 acyl-CoA synthetase [Deltaproteobacteria bacterium]